MQKRITRLITVAVLTVGGAACHGENDAGQTPGDARIQALTDEQSAMVLSKLNLGEIDAAQTALPRLVNPDIRAYAQLMIDHHSQTEASADALFRQEGISPEANAVSSALEQSVADVKAYLQAPATGSIDAI